MKLLKLNYQVLLFMSLFIFNACGNPGNSAENTESGMSDKLYADEFFKLTNQKADVSDVKMKLDNARQSGKAAFVVVTGNGVSDTDRASAIAKSAQDAYKNSVIIEMNRDEALNAELVKQWGLEGAPLPLIIVISPKGYTTGGFILQQATAQKLAELVPTPKMDDIYEALNNENAAFLIVTGKSFSDRDEVIRNCLSAVEKMKNKAVVIEMDMNDPKEGRFISQLNLQNSGNATTTLVINAHGQTTGMFEGMVATNELVMAGYRVVRSGSGCGPTCAPR